MLKWLRTRIKQMRTRAQITPCKDLAEPGEREEVITGLSLEKTEKAEEGADHLMVSSLLKKFTEMFPNEMYVAVDEKQQYCIEANNPFANLFECQSIDDLAIKPDHPEYHFLWDDRPFPSAELPLRFLLFSLFNSQDICKVLPMVLRYFDELCAAEDSVQNRILQDFIDQLIGVLPCRVNGSGRMDNLVGREDFRLGNENTPVIRRCRDRKGNIHWLQLQPVHENGLTIYRISDLEEMVNAFKMTSAAQARLVQSQLFEVMIEKMWPPELVDRVRKGAKIEDLQYEHPDVTILNLDIISFSQLLKKHGMLTTNAVRDFFKTIHQQLKPYGLQILKLTGDGMIIFAEGDKHYDRMVRFAVSLLIQKFFVDEDPLLFRIGIAHGPVHSEISLGIFELSGDPLVQAERLQDIGHQFQKDEKGQLKSVICVEQRDFESHFEEDRADFSIGQSKEARDKEGTVHRVITLAGYGKLKKSRSAHESSRGRKEGGVSRCTFFGTPCSPTGLHSSLPPSPLEDGSVPAGIVPYLSSGGGR